MLSKFLNFFNDMHIRDILIRTFNAGAKVWHCC